MDWPTTIESLVTGALGGLGTVYGLSRFLGNMWLEKQKARYSKELEDFKNQLSKEQKRIQAEIDSSVFVTRAHFETEFSAMKDIFKALAEVKMSLNAFRSYDAADRDEGNERLIESFPTKLRTLAQADRRLVIKMEELGAFYSPELYDEVNRCHIASEFEIRRLQNVRIEEIGNRLMTDDGIANHNQFGRCYSRASQIIRDRLSKLAVLPGTS
jgi:anion-transporting  ArsA/GET3 family ATPase